MHDFSKSARRQTKQNKPIGIGDKRTGFSDRKMILGSADVDRVLLAHAEKLSQRMQAVAIRNRGAVAQEMLADPLTSAEILMFEAPQLAARQGVDTDLIRMGAHTPAGSTVQPQLPQPIAAMR